MIKFHSFYVAIGMLVLLSVGAPRSLFAAEITFHVLPPVESSGNATVVEIRIDPHAKKLNVVEGTLTLSGAVSDTALVQIENGQSILPIWPIAPLYSTSTKSVNFTGGVPNGFDTEGLLFRMRISSMVPGDLTISYSSGSAYLNDGKGTKESITSKPQVIHIEQNDQRSAPGGTTRNNAYTYGIILLLVVVIIVIFTYGSKKKTTS